MKQSSLAALYQTAAVFRRLLWNAAWVVGLVVASLCLDISSTMESTFAAEGDVPADTEHTDDSTESPEAPDELVGHTSLMVAPAATGEVAYFATLGAARSGFRSRVPRPSGC